MSYMNVVYLTELRPIPDSFYEKGFWECPLDGCQPCGYSVTGEILYFVCGNYHCL